MTVRREAAVQVRRLFGMPSPVWPTPRSWRRFTVAEGAHLIDRLRRDGLVTIPGFYDREQLARIHARLNASFAHPTGWRFEFRPDQQYYACLQPLALCSEFAEGTVDSALIHLVGAYFRRMPFLAESDFRRVLPLDMAVHERENAKVAKGYSSSHWHHDLHGREIKVMVYLSDVGPDDQNFAFCLRSHSWFRTAEYARSRFTDQQLRERGLTPLEIFAPAGTAVVFDSSGIHRLRRRNTSMRDSVTFNYNPGRMYRSTPQIVDPDVLAARRGDFERLTVLTS